MDTKLEKFDEIELKIRQLVERLKLLRNENASLLEENSQLKIKIDSLNKNKEGQRSKSDAEKKQILQSNDLFERQRIREEIDSYIEEIDKCIDILKLN